MIYRILKIGCLESVNFLKLALEKCEVRRLCEYS